MPSRLPKGRPVRGDPECAHRGPPREWWQRFFESPDSIPLSYFPSERETAAEVEGVETLLRLTHEDEVLDACCGMGRHLVPLRSQGFRVVGLDYSQMMLRKARETAARAGVRCHLVRADASRLPFPSGCFTKVMNLFNSFGYSMSDEDNLRVLQESSRCLTDGGELLLETRNKLYQLAGLPTTFSVRLPGGRRLQLSSFYDRRGRRLTSEWSAPGDHEAPVYCASIRLYEVAELKAMLDASGLRLVGLYGNYRGHPFRRANRQLILHARKA